MNVCFRQSNSKCQDILLKALFALEGALITILETGNALFFNRVPD
jgi:hypothetical protein